VDLRCVDCAAEGLLFGRLHRCALRRGWVRLSVARLDPTAIAQALGLRTHQVLGSRAGTVRTPKNRGPLQAVPVMARATVERLA
jgi:hypothetical protein